MEKLKTDKKSLSKFGLTMGAAFLVISGLFFLRHKSLATAYSLVVSAVFSGAGLLMPILLKPVYIAWMRFAFVLSWVNTRILLVIIFYLVFTPVGLFMRLFRIDLLELRKKKETYWKIKEKVEFDPANYERRF